LTRGAHAGFRVERRMFGRACSSDLTSFEQRTVFCRESQYRGARLGCARCTTASHFPGMNRAVRRGRGAAHRGRQTSRIFDDPDAVSPQNAHIVARRICSLYNVNVIDRRGRKQLKNPFILPISFHVRGRYSNEIASHQSLSQCSYTTLIIQCRVRPAGRNSEAVGASSGGRTQDGPEDAFPGSCLDLRWNRVWGNNGG
jgi:hypothetical protein